jgi:hypothetical protein
MWYYGGLRCEEFSYPYHFNNVPWDLCWVFIVPHTHTHTHYTTCLRIYLKICVAKGFLG